MPHLYGCVALVVITLPAVLFRYTVLYVCGNVCGYCFKLGNEKNVMTQPIIDKDISNTALQDVCDWYYANLKTSELAEFKEMEADQLDQVCELYRLSKQFDLAAVKDIK